MNLGVVGLGLIGGSMAKAYHRDENWKVFGDDQDKSVVSYAMLREELQGKLTKETIKECDLILIALYPKDTCLWLEEYAPLISPNTIVIDLCGTKQMVCKTGFSLAKEYGWTFVGGHPMAGTQFSGYKNAKPDLFDGETMVIVPEKADDIFLLDKVKKLLSPANFLHINVTTAEKHDEMIAFTSQMAHLVSNAYIKSPTATKHKGFSAGSYKDLTRVSKLNDEMWSQLFLENSEFLSKELEGYIQTLLTYQKALKEKDGVQLKELLKEGSLRKAQIDGEVDF